MDALTSVANNGTQAAPFIVKVVEDIPEMAPIVLRNAEGAVQVGKTALNVLKGGAVLFGTGLLVGTGTMLVVGGAMTSVWGITKAVGGVKGFFEKRAEKKEQAKVEKMKQEVLEKAGIPAPAPA